MEFRQGFSTHWNALTAMCSHVPNKGEQMVRYYSYYSNAAREKRKLPQRAHARPIDDFSAYDEHPELTVDDYIRDPDYPAETYL